MPKDLQRVLEDQFHALRVLSLIMSQKILRKPRILECQENIPA